MIRTLALAAVLAAGLAAPALADTATDRATGATATPAGNLFTHDQARQHLARLGYTNVSELQKDANGKWVGTAVKDGKQLPVAVDIKRTPQVQ